MVRLYGVFMLFLALAGLGGGVLMALRGVLWVSVIMCVIALVLSRRGISRILKKAPRE